MTLLALSELSEFIFSELSNENSAVAFFDLLVDYEYISSRVYLDPSFISIGSFLRLVRIDILFELSVKTYNHQRLVVFKPNFDLIDIFEP